MPELPEVETTRRGIEPALLGRRISELIVRDPRLRQPVDPDLPMLLRGRLITELERRAKYIVIRLDYGSLVCHLGMSGSMRIVEEKVTLLPHDHIDLVLDDGKRLRFNDPRRFGSFFWCEEPFAHPLLASLGPEPLGDKFNGTYLYARSRGRRQAVKNFIMDQKIVVGVGNIYASEALYQSGILPQRQAGRISKQRYEHLAERIRCVLGSAIEQGGTTLRDFVQSDGRPGYFYRQLNVYDREGEPCRTCGRAVQNRMIGQRSSYYCSHCQR